MDTHGDVYWQNSSGDGNNIVGGMEADKWYTFRLRESYDDDSDHIVMETTAQQVRQQKISLIMWEIRCRDQVDLLFTKAVI